MEIAVGVYVGRISARVRDKLWARVVETSKGGRAVLVFATNNEQRMDFRIHGETWEPIDYDGLKLMLRPSPTRLKAALAKRDADKKLGFSNAAKFKKAKGAQRNKAVSATRSSPENTSSSMGKSPRLCEYVVLDVETTGLKPMSSEITEIGALKIANGSVTDVFQSLVKIEGVVPGHIVEMTGITDEMLATHGRPLANVLEELLEFSENLPIVAHNAPFDISFINAGLKLCGLDLLRNNVVDTLDMAKVLHKGLESYKLKALLIHFGLRLEKLEKQESIGGLQLHRSLGDCYLAHLLYEKLMDLRSLGM